MRLVARKPHVFDLGEGSIVDGYVVERVDSHGQQLEVICEAIGPDGDLVSLAMARKPPADRHAWEQFRRAARVRATLRHRALLPVRAVGEHAGRPYLAMDRYPAETFNDVLDGSPLSPQRVLTLLAPVCDALDAAHAHGLVHQNLSGTSLLIDGDAILLDGFGVAAGPPGLSFNWVGAHDIRFSPPEALNGQAVEPASNVYSVASLLVHALTGAPPYEGSRAAQSYGHLMEPAPVPSRRIPELGAALDGVIAAGMAKDPTERPSSARELLTAAARALRINLPSRAFPSGAEDHRTNGRPRQVAVQSRRMPTLAVITALAAGAVVGVVSGVLIDPFGGDSSAAKPSGDAGALQRLDDQRTLLRSRLSDGGSPQEQAQAAAELAAAYGQASRTADSPPLVAASKAAERAYAGLAAAAEDGSAAGYASASDEVTRAEQQLAVTARQR